MWEHAAFLALLLAASVLRAASIEGVAVDNFTGRPLARAAVSLEPIGVGGAATLSVYTGAAGQFAFHNLPAGAYLLSASRRGFMTLRYGQRRWDTAARPVWIEARDALTLTLRLRRLGAISGVIWDENEIGFADVPVLAYHATRPPTLAAQTKTDDRGWYRLGELEPGRYHIRTAPLPLEAGPGLIPTFFKEVASLDQARVVEVELEAQADEVSFRPLFGPLWRLSGRVAWPRGPGSITLISEMGALRATTDSSGAFRFDGLASGDYELLWESIWGEEPVADYQQIVLGEDHDVLLHPTRLPRLQVVLEDGQGQPVDPKDVSLLVRRKDLSGRGMPHKLAGGGGDLLPGRWEFLIVPPEDRYAVSVTGEGLLGGTNDAGRWREVRLAYGARVHLRAVLSSQPASLRGIVTDSRGEPVAGAPVFLQKMRADATAGWEDLRLARSGLRGEYRFGGLSPGRYRLVSSFDFAQPDAAAMETARAQAVSLDEADDLEHNLTLYGQP